MIATVDVDWEIAPVFPSALARKTAAELITRSAVRAILDDRKDELRPVYCPKCGTHFTTHIPPENPRAATCVHYVCASCGGDGRPATLAVPR